MAADLRRCLLMLATAVILGCLDTAFLASKLCDEDGLCVKGYHCDPDVLRCVPGVYSPDVSAQNSEDSGGPVTSEPSADSTSPDPAALPSEAGALEGGEDPANANQEDEDDIANVNPDDPTIVVPEPIVEYSFALSPHPPVVPDEAPADPAVALQPADKTDGGHTFENGAVCFTDGRLQADDADSKKLTQALVGAGSLTVAFWVSTSNLDQSGVIVTHSSGISTRAFTLSQKKKDLLLRLRTSVTDENGTTYPQTTTVFKENGKALYLAFVYRGDTGASKLFVNGKRVDRVFHLLAKKTPATLNWNVERERFGLGNEIGIERPWKGCLHKISIYDKPLVGNQLFKLYKQGL